MVATDCGGFFTYFHFSASFLEQSLSHKKKIFETKRIRIIQSDKQHFEFSLKPGIPKDKLAETKANSRHSAGE